MGLLARYMSGLSVAVIGLCASGWLMLAPVAFGYRGLAPHHTALHRAALGDRVTGGGLAVVSLLTLIFWAIAWRRKLRADGVLPRISRRRARREEREERDVRRRDAAGQAESAPDPAQVLSELRALLLPLLAESPAAAAAAEPAGALPKPAAAPAAAAEPVVVPELHHHGAVPEPRSELEPFRPAAGQSAEADSYPFAAALVPVRAVPLEQLTTPAPSGIAAIESMLAGAELSMVGCGEEETW
jgi:hypothetical protein